MVMRDSELLEKRPSPLHLTCGALLPVPCKTDRRPNIQSQSTEHMLSFRFDMWEPICLPGIRAGHFRISATHIC